MSSQIELRRLERYGVGRLVVPDRIACWTDARAGALGADAEASPSDQRDLLLAVLVAEATGRE